MPKGYTELLEVRLVQLPQGRKIDVILREDRFVPCKPERIEEFANIIQLSGPITALSCQ